MHNRPVWGVALVFEKLKLFLLVFHWTPYQSATFILFFVLIYALRDGIKYEINTLNSVSTQPLPPLEQCNGEKLFSLFSAGRERVK